MKTQFYLLLITWSMLIASDNNIVEQRSFIDERTVHRTGDYGLIYDSTHNLSESTLFNRTFALTIGDSPTSAAAEWDDHSEELCGDAWGHSTSPHWMTTCGESGGILHSDLGF